ncbi:TIGR02444 family protein [Hyphococcus lacteus]|uniref:TIGR02444 family protein n=1 Tax=Hyphococcus lacteus TaxID=3143536 RepID=A0ABV3Z6E8_9PROT
MRADDNPFWLWSLAHYGRAELTLLRLQDEHQCDVNIILFCCWCSEEYAALDQTDLNAAITLSQDWTAQIIKPIRAARKHLKNAIPPQEALRDTVKNAELSAEHALQNMLYQFATERLKSAKNKKNNQANEIARKNLGFYDAQLLPKDRAREALLQDLIPHIFATSHDPN